MDRPKLLKKDTQLTLSILTMLRHSTAHMHVRLLTKLESYGLTGNLLGWLKSFLSERKQKVVLNIKGSHHLGVMYLMACHNVLC